MGLRALAVFLTDGRVAPPDGWSLQPVRNLWRLVRATTDEQSP